jgi:hypothetical protein
MPLRAKYRPLSAAAEAGIRTPSPFGARFAVEPPDIEIDDNLREVIKKLSM